MSKLKGIVMPRKQRDPYVEMSMEDMQAIFGGDPIKPGRPGGTGDPTPIFAKDDQATACVIIDRGKLDTQTLGPIANHKNLLETDSYT